jgi:hypothetical protein
MDQKINTPTPQDNYKERFFLGNTGAIIKYAINGLPLTTPIDQETKSLISFLRLNPETKLIVRKIKEQLKLDNPNTQLLFILKSKIERNINNYNRTGKVG